MNDAPRIAILDYGMGNLRSVEKALEHVGARATITSDAAERARRRRPHPARRRRLPEGDGARARAGAGRADRRAPRAGVPILGICLGLQLLFELDDRAGRRRRASGCSRARSPSSRPAGLKVPHIGWSPVRWERESRLTDGIESETPFYFVHSFAPRPGARPSCSAPPPTAPASPARPSATTSSASSSTPRSRAPPACGCSPTSPGSARSVAGVILYPGDRHPRRQRGAAAAGRLRARDGLRRRSGRRRDALGRAKARGSCTSSTSTAPGPARRGTWRRCGGSPPRSRARSRSAEACATPSRSPRRSTPAPSGW